MQANSIGGALPAAAPNYTKARLKRYRQLYLILIVPLAFLILFNYVPIFFGLILSFKEFSPSKGILGSPGVGLKHFAFFFSNQSSLSTVWNSLSLALYSIAAGFLPPIILAISFNELRNPAMKKTAQTITYAPYFISTVVMVSIIIQVLDVRTGLINRAIVAMGGKSQNFMAIGKLFVNIYVISGIWQATGFNAIIFLAALAGVDPGLYEAASIDGASKVQRILHIDIPALIPTITVLLILNVGQIMGATGFEKIFLMQNPANMGSSEVISTYVYKIGLLSNNFGFSTAISMFNSAVNLVLVFLANTFARRVGDARLW
jgi:putative aldouronate transport system permease protein